MTGNKKRERHTEYTSTERKTRKGHSERTSSSSLSEEPGSEDDDEEIEADIQDTDKIIKNSTNESDRSEDQETNEITYQPLEEIQFTCPSPSVESMVSPVIDSIELAKSSEENLWSVDGVEASVNTTIDKVHDVVEPIGDGNTVSNLATVSVSTNRSSQSVTNHCKPTGRSAMRVRTPASVQLGQRTVRLKHSDQTTTRANTAVTELTEILEFEEWETDDGETSTPLTRRRPQVIIHKQPQNEPDSFEYLCRVLRDYYTLIEGGEPTVSAVEFVSNRPRIPPLSNQVIRLDMTGDEWELEAGADRVYARRENSDILPKLATLSRTQFAGSLGFLVINIPARAGQSPFATDGISTRIYDYLTDAIGNENNQNTTVVHTSSSTNRANWGAAMSEYLGFEIDADERTVREIEDQYLQQVEQPDWHAIALTERQDDIDGDDDESDRHYLYKSAIANKIGRVAYQNTDDQDHDTYQEFLFKSVSDHVLTEEKREAKPDIFIDWSKWDGYTAGLLETFVDDDTIEWDMVDQVAIEFETGRAEGAFEFRKISETVNKYDDTEVDLVAIVTSPWVIEIDRIKRGQYSQIEKLVEQKDRFSDEREFRTYIPKFDSGGCSGLENITGETHYE